MFFGIAEALPFLVFWPLAILLLGAALFFASRSANKFELADWFWSMVWLAVIFHVFGFVNLTTVWQMAKDHWQEIPGLIGLDLLIGFGWMCFKGLAKLIRHRFRLRDQLRQYMSKWDEDYPQATPDWREKEKLKWVEKHRVDVSAHKWEMIGWWLLWPFDMAWELIFQWVERLSGIAELVWNALRGTFQRVADGMMRGLAKGI